MDKFNRDLERNHFEIFHQVSKILTKEEVLNIFYNHRNAHYFAGIFEHMMTSESVVMLLINKSDYVQNQEDPDGEDNKLDTPVIRWK